MVNAAKKRDHRQIVYRENKLRSVLSVDQPINKYPQHKTNKYRKNDEVYDDRDKYCIKNDIAQ